VKLRKRIELGKLVVHVVEKVVFGYKVQLVGMKEVDHQEIKVSYEEGPNDKTTQNF